MPRLALDEGFELHYEVHGPDPSTDAPAVLLAHGAGGNSMSWWQQVPALAERYTTITFDHRAFGRSPDGEEGPGRIAFGADARALLDHLGVQRVHFVAHSMGGRTAFGLLARAPERLSSIVYSGTNGGCVDDRYRELRRRLEVDGTMDGSLLQRAVAPGYKETEPAMQYLYHRIRGLNPRRPKNFLAPSPRLVNYRGSTAQRLRDSGLSIMWMVGEHDTVIPAQLIRISHDLTPGSRYHEISGAGHSSYFERPHDFNAALIDFLDSASDRDAAEPAAW